jgi:signal transduction histidine kinase
LKYKFFSAIFLALSVMAFSVSSIHYYFFKAERLRLIELNLQQNGNLLRNTNLDLSRVEFSNKGNELIEQVIGDDKINVIVSIYNEKGNVLYKNENAYIFDEPDKIDPHIKEWEDVEAKDYFIKYLTFFDSDQNRIVRVGMILNQSLLRWKDLNQRIIIYVLIILVVVSLGSFLLTEALFRPISLISKDVKLMASKIDAGEFKELRSWFSSKRVGKRVYRDEFANLLSSLDLLAERISENQLHMQKWAALMAHELKTPMTRLKNSVEGFTVKKDEKYLKSIELELSLLEAVVMDFLAWASLENDQSRPELHAVSLKKRLLAILKTFEAENPSIQFEMKFDSDDHRVFCSPLHFDQLVTNLISNSIKYSNEKRILIEVTQGLMQIRDYGKGIPQGVMDNLGKPFNRYNSEGIEGHGLGLAWVKTICKKYGWELNIASSPESVISVKFNDAYN